MPRRCRVLLAPPPPASCAYFEPQTGDGEDVNMAQSDSASNAEKNAAEATVTVSAVAVEIVEAQ